MNAPIDWRNSATMSTIDVSPTEALVAQSFHRGRLSIVDEHSRRCAHIEDLRKGPLPVARGTTRNHMEYLRTWDDIRVDPERFYLLRLVTNGSVRISHDDANTMARGTWWSPNRGFPRMNGSRPMTRACIRRYS